MGNRGVRCFDAGGFCKTGCGSGHRKEITKRYENSLHPTDTVYGDCRMKPGDGPFVHPITRISNDSGRRRRYVEAGWPTPAGGARGGRVRRKGNAVAVELLTECGMIFGAGFPVSTAGGTLIPSDAAAIKHQVRIVCSGPALAAVRAAPAVRGMRVAAPNGNSGCEMLKTVYVGENLNLLETRRV
jgi:hypothetical protein